MKVCLINNLYNQYARGGAEAVVKNIENEAEKENEVFVITTSPFSVGDKKEGNVYFLKSMFHSLNKIPFILRIGYHVWDTFNFINYFKIKKILKKEIPDVVMTHNLKGIGFLIPRLIKSLKIKHIHTLHDIQLLHPSGLMFYGEEKKINSISAKVYQFINKKLFALTDIIISPSKWLLDEHSVKGFFKNATLKVIPNSFSKEDNNKKEIKEKNNSTFKFLYVGLLSKHKGVHILIDAFRQLEKLNFNNIKLELIGDGDLMAEIKDKIVNHKIEILGRMSNDKVKHKMSQSDCLVVPSICYENSPTVIYEAIACSLPVIASDIGGIPELIDSIKGIKFQPNNELDLVNKMKEALGDKERLEKIKNKENNFEYNNYSKEIISLIKG